MKVIKTTDGKYLGHNLPDELKVGDIVDFQDFSFQIMFVRRLDNHQLTLGSPNYQLVCEA